jgi:spermidine synthase
LVSEKKFDIIISEPSNPWISGIGNLFSKEFYELSASRLKDGGFFAQWVHAYALRTEDMRMIVNTFISVYPELYIVQTSSGDLLLLGSRDELPPLSEKDIAARLKGKVAERMKVYLNVSDPLDVVSFITVGKRGAAEIAKGARINTDDVPILEFSAPYALYADTAEDNVNLLHGYMSMPDLSGFDYPGNLYAEFLYRKSRNYYELEMFQDWGWIKEARSFDVSNPDYIIYETKLVLTERNELAKRFWEDIALRFPDHPRANFEFAMLLKETDREKADTYFERAISLDPDNFNYVFWAADNKREMGRYRKALEYYLTARELPHQNSLDNEILYYTGICQVRTGRLMEGVEFIEKASELNPYNPTILYDLIRLYSSYPVPAEKACGVLEKIGKFHVSDRKPDLDKELSARFASQCGAQAGIDKPVN